MNEIKDKTDEELILEYKKSGNRYYLEVIILRHSDACFRTAMRYMGNQSDAEDVLQFALIQFIQNLHQLREGTITVKPWLMKIILNASMCKKREEKQRNHRQRKVASQRIMQYEEQAQISENNDDKEELKKKVLHQVEELPEKYRAPILLILYEGFSYPEVATVLDLPEKTIRTQVARGLDRLRQSISSLGTILSVTLIQELISETKLEITPTRIKEMIKSPEFYQKTTSQSNLLIHTNNHFLIKFSKILLWALPAIGLLILGLTIIKKDQNITKNPTINSTPFYLSLNFNQKTLSTPYLFSETFQLSESGGFNDTGCVDLNKTLIFKLPIKKDQLPLKISFDIFIKKNQAYDFACLWSEWDRLGRFINTNGSSAALLEEAKINWSQMTIWVTATSIDTWVNHSQGKKRINLDILDSIFKDTKNLYILFPSNIKIDNLIIESTQFDKIPNIDKYVKSNYEIFTKSLTTETPLENLPNENNSKKQPYHLKVDKSTEGELTSYFNSLN